MLKCDFCGIGLNEQASVQFIIKGSKDLHFCSALCLFQYDVIIRHYGLEKHGISISELAKSS